MDTQIISKVSRGTKMDQIYIPKNRIGLGIGEYVIILPLEKEITKSKKIQFKPYFHDLKDIEPIKLKIIQEIFSIIEQIKPDNIIITGSFLEKGFRFNDIDILIITENSRDITLIKHKIENFGIKTHLIVLDNKTLISGLSTDPIYSLMLNRCVSKNRIIYKFQRKINPKFLDLTLLKSKTLLDNFEILNGDEKYYLTFNMISILLFLKEKKLAKEIIDKEIEKTFNVSIEKIRENLIDKGFLIKFRKVYNNTFDLIMERLKNE
ncbi:hypothetical protein COV15_03335 [Candidatus Woesearchaeota archaeon CG10_big_fil_rev_8_21_14_0_10_34_12]|nr:MAG: hypothetical protein COV15_03335 [Candidatus Woesearchaeota archaeon CG10_big_fil_rev_8_21_14_0_10_34_12]